ncbi:hypothetical protein BG74_02635 [Sodalis-like endosymbiont of Proechinophthirus fluctus]|uniref:hypothetical protein n=1 Tax=Sodalis-like endosymbiont of Proechinophthirus fluctus TaxID=1462730 RepID=UPI0007A8D8CB|nr:hypothetical protein BG74_02635 [Sodalis-like endosymbiont of Proechinophthirus fluctus]
MQSWITLLTHLDYLKIGSRHPLVVMVTKSIPEVTRGLLIKEGCRVREVYSAAHWLGIRAHSITPARNLGGLDQICRAAKGIGRYRRFDNYLSGAAISFGQR